MEVLRCAQDDITQWFTPAELELAATFKLEKRRNEWLLSRIAAKELAVRLGIASDPRTVVISRPTLVIDGLQSDWYVSLSHSAPYAAAAIAREPIGLDIQVVREFPEQAAHLFLTDDEERVMESCTLTHRLLHYWCAKEAVWKRQQGAIPALRRVPLRLFDQRDDGLLFDAAETVAIDDAILAITRPTS
jgi:phosphopantetheinyl transferase